MGEQLAVLYQFSRRKTGAGITRTRDFAASLMGGSTTQSGSCDESASKKLKITGTTYLTTTDFTMSIKVDVEKSVLEGETKLARATCAKRSRRRLNALRAQAQ
jgi:hypothetical protein